MGGYILRHLDTVDVWGGYHVVGRPAHCRMLSSIPGLYSLNASNILPVVTVRNVSRHYPVSPEGKMGQAENHGLNVNV